MKNILSLTLKLLLITAVVAGALGAINMVTAPIIAENSQKEFELSMTEVLPGASDFEEVENLDYTPSENGVKVESLYTAGDSGYVASAVCSEGYGGDVTVMVGIDSEFNVKKIKVMEMSETPGLGAKAQDEDFASQYDGLGYGIKVDKNGSAAGAEYKISAISGATITSKAVTKAVNAAIEAAETEGGAK